MPTVPKALYKSTLSKKPHLHRFNFVDTHICDCGEDTQNIEHVIMHWPLRTINRNKMIEAIELEYVKRVKLQNPPPIYLTYD